MNIQDVDLNLLRAFDAVLQDRSVTGAAARLGLDRMECELFEAAGACRAVRVVGLMTLPHTWPALMSARDPKVLPRNYAWMPVYELCLLLPMVIGFAAIGVYIYRKRHELFDRDPEVENDIPAVRHIRFENIIFVWSALTIILFCICVAAWRA